MAGQVYHVSPSGNDSASGSASSPWKTIGKAAGAAVAGDTVIIHAGIYHESLSPQNSGTSESARITFQAAAGEEVILEGGTAQLKGWTPIGNNIYQINLSSQAFGVFQDTFETLGMHATLWDMEFNQYDSNPNYDLHDFDPSHDYYGGIQDDAHKKHDWRSQFKWANGVLRVRTVDGLSPDQHNVRAAISRTAIAIDGKSYITLSGIKTRHWRNSATVDNCRAIRFEYMDMRYSGYTSMWVTNTRDFTMVHSVVQGGGSGVGHYEDAIDCKNNTSGTLTFEDNDISQAGHCGLIVLDGLGSHLVVRRNWIHDNSGSALTMKRDNNDGIFEDNLLQAPDITKVNCHKVDHDGVQLSGDRNVFRRNLFYRSGNGLAVSCSDTQTSNNGLFEYNTFAHFNFEAILLEAYDAQYQGRLNNNVFRNNIFVDAKASLLWLDIPGGESTAFWGNTFVNNVFHDGTIHPWTACGSGCAVDYAQSHWPTVFQGNIDVDPMFVNDSGNDYHLKPGSPAVGKGVYGSGVPAPPKSLRILAN